MANNSEKELSLNADIEAAVAQMKNENIQFETLNQVQLESFDFMKSLHHVDNSVLSERSSRGGGFGVLETPAVTEKGTFLSRFNGLGEKCGGKGEELFQCATALLAKSSANADLTNQTNGDHNSSKNYTNNDNNNYKITNNVTTDNTNYTDVCNMDYCNNNTNADSKGKKYFLNNNPDSHENNNSNNTDYNNTNQSHSVQNENNNDNSKNDNYYNENTNNISFMNPSQQNIPLSAASTGVGERAHYSPVQPTTNGAAAPNEQYSSMHMLSSVPNVPPPHTPPVAITASNTNPTIKLDEVYEYIADLTVSSKREKALLELSRRREMVPDLAPLLWYSFGVITAILQEIISIYAYLTPPNLTSISSNRVCNALALLQTVAAHPDTRQAFLNAHIPLLLYPFLNTISMSRPFEYLRLTSLGVIGALVKMDDPEVIGFLLQTEIISLCLRIMEMGSELSKTVATFVVQKILLNDLGLRYVCATAERFYALSSVLGGMVTTLVTSPSSRLLKHIVKCYLRLTDNQRAREALKKCIPVELRDGSIIGCVQEDSTTRQSLVTLLSLIDSKAAKQLMETIPAPTTNPPTSTEVLNNSEIKSGGQSAQVFRQQNSIQQFPTATAQYQTTNFDTSTKAAIAAATAALQNANATRTSNGSTTLDAATVETISAALKAVSTKTATTPPKLTTQPPIGPQVSQYLNP